LGPVNEIMKIEFIVWIYNLKAVSSRTASGFYSNSFSRLCNINFVRSFFIASL